MKKQLLKQLNLKLEKEKQALEKELQVFAKKDPKLEGDWDTHFPKFNKDHPEETANKIEEYSALLPIEYALEIKLQNINLSLKKIKENKYGKCEKCQKEISEKRLKVCPEARTCSKCKES